ncbi:hypothetical protein [Sphingomonas sanguinis]|uniref:hypothetical protein n=1 Tax=Sphingomonas sanguinis TaxID=33051 RepID=UPI003018C324
MSNLVQDALLAHLPPRARRTTTLGGIKYTFNCPACAHRGHNADTRQRGAIFVNYDGSTGYSCFNCQLDTRQDPRIHLAHKMNDVLRYLGMSEEDRNKLRFHVSQEVYRRQQGGPEIGITKRDLPSGAILIKYLRNDPPNDSNYRDVMADLADMSDDIRDSYYWTPEPGPSGDMNRRYIWFFGSVDDPVGWAAKSIDNEDEPLLSDPNIWFFEEPED